MKWGGGGGGEGGGKGRGDSWLQVVSFRRDILRFWLSSERLFANPLTRSRCTVQLKVLFFYADTVIVFGARSFAD